MYCQCRCVARGRNVANRARAAEFKKLQFSSRLFFTRLQDARGIDHVATQFGPPSTPASADKLRTYCSFAMFQKFDLEAAAGFQLDPPAPR